MKQLIFVLLPVKKILENSKEFFFPFEVQCYNIFSITVNPSLKSCYL